MNAAGWFQVLIALRDDQRAVLHQPETARYSRARTKLGYLLVNASPLGIRAGEGGRDSAIELACWARPSTGRGHGYLAIFRLLLEEGQAVFAILFCFYDGTEGSPGFRSLSAAATHARSTGFSEVLDEDNPRH